MTLEDYFSALPAQEGRSGLGPARERPIFEAVMAHLETLGDVTVEPVSVGIFLKRSRGFAELRPKVNWVELSFGLSHTIDHPKIARVIRTSATRSYHFVKLREPDDVDDDVRNWLSEAYLALEP